MRGTENISKYYVLEGLAVFFFSPQVVRTHPKNAFLAFSGLCSPTLSLLV